VHDKKQRSDRSYPNTERAREGEFRSTRRFSVFCRKRRAWILPPASSTRKARRRQSARAH